MESPKAPLGRRVVPVIDRREVGRYHLIEVQDDSGPTPRSGQFYMLSTTAGWGGDVTPGRPFLPRALSVCTISSGRLGFLLEDVGPGTHRFASCKIGEEIFLTGPLGNSFSRLHHSGVIGAQPILVAGGVGIPPLAVLERELISSGERPIVLAGFRDPAHLPGAALFHGSVRVATESGYGKWQGDDIHSGFVTDLLIQEVAHCPPCVVYACGPPPMLEAVREICAEREIPAELAMEVGMACGFGACFGCVIETVTGYRRLCVDGPIVGAAELESVLPLTIERANGVTAIGG